MVKFLNPKLEELYKALSNIFPSVGWQDAGEPNEMICLPIVIRSNCEPTSICHHDTLWINAETAETFGFFRSETEYAISFDFEKFGG